MNFEELFQQWLRGDKRALREDLERELRAGKPKVTAQKCGHGNSPLTCSICYFHGPDHGL